MPKNAQSKKGKSPARARPGPAADQKVGASRKAARKVGGKLDFGTPAKRARPAERRVKTRLDRPSQRSGQEGQRVVGVGMVGDTPGKSGGAVDTDILGIGTQGGSSVSTEGTLGKRRGKDIVKKGGSAAFASGPPSKRPADQKLVGKVGGTKRVRGTTHNAGDADGTSSTGVGDYLDHAQDDVYDPNTASPGNRIRSDKR